MATAIVNASNNGDNQLVAGKAGIVIRVLSYVLVPQAAVACTFKSGTAADGGSQTALTGPMTIGTTGLYPGWVAPYGPGFTEGYFDTLPGESLNLFLGAGTQVGGHLNYRFVKQ